MKLKGDNNRDGKVPQFCEAIDYKQEIFMMKLEKVGESLGINKMTES